MTSKEFIREISKKTGKTQKELREFADIFENAIKDKMVDGEKVKAFDLTFMVVETAPRVARNMQTNEPIEIPAGKTVKIKKSQDFKDLLK